ncbi:MAG: recombination protein RecR [bacterium]|nr:recombination protein RecR [bacterium]
MQYPETLNKLIQILKSLPGIGPRMAERVAMHILKMETPDINNFAYTLIDVNQKIKNCSTCHAITEIDPCEICTSTTRDTSIICIVEQPSDIFAIEKTNDFHGLYHVLNGVISPIDGISPGDLNIRTLLTRINEDVNEIIVATNPNVEGEATSIYLAKILKPLGVKISRIAHGVPVGSDLEYIDSMTILKAFEGRQKI